MSSFVNGHLIYGFTDKNRDDKVLIDAICEKYEEEKGNKLYIEWVFEDLFKDMQKKHHITLFSIYEGSINIVAAFSASAGAKGVDCTVIDPAAMTLMEEYNKNLSGFLEDIGINPESWKAKWYLFGYID